MEKKELEEEISNETAGQKQKKASKKDKWLLPAGFVVILAISIATSRVNIMDEITGLVKKVWNGTQEIAGNYAEVETLATGSHVKIKSTDVVYVREIYEILGEDIDQEQAVEILKEIKTLAYHGTSRGVSASSKEKDAFIEELKTMLTEADEAQYERVVRRYGDEKDYWTVLDDAIGEYVIAQKVREDKRQELENKKNVDVEKELQEYIDEIVGYESFQE